MYCLAYLLLGDGDLKRPPPPPPPPPPPLQPPYLASGQSLAQWPVRRHLKHSSWLWRKRQMKILLISELNHGFKTNHHQQIGCLADNVWHFRVLPYRDLFCLFGFFTSSSATRLYHQQVPRLTSDNFMCCHTRDGAERPWLLSNPITLYWHRPSRERAATAGIEPTTSSPGVAPSTDWATVPPIQRQTREAMFVSTGHIISYTNIPQSVEQVVSTWIKPMVSWKKVTKQPAYLPLAPDFY